MGILVKNGEIITAAERFVGDVYCSDGKIVAVGPGLEKRSSDDTVIDASVRGRLQELAYTLKG